MLLSYLSLFIKILRLWVDGGKYFKRDDSLLNSFRLKSPTLIMPESLLIFSFLCEKNSLTFLIILS
jgi:hypothetical protein